MANLQNSNTSDQRKPLADFWAYRTAIGAAVIVLVTCTAYLPALGGGFILDDDLLLQNQLVKDPGGLARIWFTTDPIDYWPLTNTLFWLQWRLWGASPTGYHLTNLALHIGAALLVWAVLRQLLIPGAFLAALLFAVHPVNVESVAWISQLKTILATVFFLLSVFCYLKADPPRGLLDQRLGFSSPARTWYGLSIAAYLLGMLSKASVATLPLVLLLLVWWNRGQVTRRDLWRTVPYFVFAVPLVLVNMWFQNRYSHEIIRSFAERLVGAGAIPWFYLSKALWPFHLVFIYPQWDIRPSHPLWWLPLAATIAVTAVLYGQRHTAWGRPLLFAWAFYWLALAPILGFADVSYMKWSLVADHYQYLALISVVALLAAAIAQGLARASRQTAQAALAALVALLMLLTWQQSNLYRDPITIYQHTIDKNPSSWISYNNLGKNLIMVGRYQDAIGYLETALKLNPSSDQAQNNLGNALLNTGRTLEAIQPLEEAVRLNPHYADAHVNLGIARFKANRPEEAIAELRHAARLRPDLPEAFCNLGAVLLNTGKPQEAIEALNEALRINDDYLEGWANLALANHRLGRSTETIVAAERALALAQAEGASGLAQRMEILLKDLRGAMTSRQVDVPEPALPPAAP